MDDIEDYFRSPLVQEGVISECGGVLAYWTSKLETRPRVARMALDYLSAPGKYRINVCWLGNLY